MRRTQTAARGRSVDITIEDGSGLATVFATLFTPNAKAVDARLNAFASTVCPADPRTKDQRRSDALGALALGAERLSCLCDTDDCPAADIAPSTGVVVYVIAHHDTITPHTHTRRAPTARRPDDDSTPEDPPAPEDACGAENAGVEPESTTPEPAVTDDGPAEECAGLDGVAPPMFTKPLRELTLTEALTPAPGYLSDIRPAAMMGGGFLPGAIARRAALGATIRPIVHPGQAPPEPRYTPSKKLADFVRCRDLTCRFPGCTAPATHCDVDHTIPWPYGPTGASNLKCLCRLHHLLKTFWGGDGGWRDQQLPDGTVIWTAPDGRTHTTTPGSRLLFPSSVRTHRTDRRDRHTDPRTPPGSPCRDAAPPAPKTAPAASTTNAKPTAPQPNRKSSPWQHTRRNRRTTRHLDPAVLTAALAERVALQRRPEPLDQLVAAHRDDGR